MAELRHLRVHKRRSCESRAICRPRHRTSSTGSRSRSTVTRQADPSCPQTSTASPAARHRTTTPSDEKAQTWRMPWRDDPSPPAVSRSDRRSPSSSTRSKTIPTATISGPDGPGCAITARSRTDCKNMIRPSTVVVECPGHGRSPVVSVRTLRRCCSSNSSVRRSPSVISSVPEGAHTGAGIGPAWRSTATAPMARYDHPKPQNIGRRKDGARHRRATAVGHGRRRLFARSVPGRWGPSKGQGCQQQSGTHVCDRGRAGSANSRVHPSRPGTRGWRLA